jgi:hypothetical protein
MTPKVRMFYGALSTDFSTACVEKCFEEVAGRKFQVSSSKLKVLWVDLHQQRLGKSKNLELET